MVIDEISLKKVGEGFVEKAVDAVLVLIYFNLEAPFLTRNKRYLIGEKVSEDLENFDYQQLKRALNHLKNKGLVDIVKEANSLPKITQSGEKRLKSILPYYDKTRTWDGKIYLITYDIPQTRNKLRDYLRNYLRKIGCGMLQQSIWVTPYNPTKLVEKFVKENDLSEGLVLVSSIGKSGTIGQMTLPELMEIVFKLSSLNQRYLEMIADFKSGKTAKAQLVFNFLSILEDDPQLPFSLLPEDWAGDKAYKIFKGLPSLKFDKMME